MKIFFRTLKILAFLVPVVVWSVPMHATTLEVIGKTAGSAEIDSFNPTTSYCTRMRDATAKSVAMQFNQTGTNCVFYIYGIVPSTVPTYLITVNLFYMTTDTGASKVVEMTGSAEALIDHAASGSGAERNTAITTGTFTTTKTHVSRQIYDLNQVLSIKKPDNSACDSTCDNTELALRIKGSASTTVSAGSLYFLGYSISWTN